MIHKSIISEIKKFLSVNHHAVVNPIPKAKPIISIYRKTNNLKFIPLCSPKHGSKNNSYVVANMTENEPSVKDKKIIKYLIISIRTSTPDSTKANPIARKIVMRITDRSFSYNPAFFHDQALENIAVIVMTVVDTTIKMI